jgi:hypothetical protein
VRTTFEPFLPSLYITVPPSNAAAALSQTADITVLHWPLHSDGSDFEIGGITRPTAA